MLSTPEIQNSVRKSGQWQERRQKLDDPHGWRGKTANCLANTIARDNSRFPFFCRHVPNKRRGKKPQENKEIVSRWNEEEEGRRGLWSRRVCEAWEEENERFDEFMGETNKHSKQFREIFELEVPVSKRKKYAIQSTWYTYNRLNGEFHTWRAHHAAIQGRSRDSDS